MHATFIPVPSTVLLRNLHTHLPFNCSVTQYIFGPFCGQDLRKNRKTNIVKTVSFEHSVRVPHISVRGQNSEEMATALPWEAVEGEEDDGEGGADEEDFGFANIEEVFVCMCACVYVCVCVCVRV